MTGDNRNLILAIVLSALVLFGWTYVSERWLAPEPVPVAEQTAGTTDGSGIVLPPAAEAAPGIAGAPAAVVNAVAPEQTVDEVLATGGRVKIKTPRLEGSINLVGARIDDLVLLDHKQTIKRNSPSVRLFSPSGTQDAYFAGFGWVGAEAPPADAHWMADRDMLTPDTPVTLRWQNDAGLQYALTFSVDKDYLFTVQGAVHNGSPQAVSLKPYGYVNRAGEGPDNSTYLNHVGPVGVLDGTLKEVKYKDLAKSPENFRSTGGWVGITDHHWLAALIPDQKAAVDARFTPAGSGRTQVDFAQDAEVVAAGASVSGVSRLYAGAKEIPALNKVMKEQQVEKFDLAISWGWLGFLAKPIAALLHWLYDLVGNYALAIVCLTLIVRAFLFPIANKQYASMAKMRVFQPKVKEIQAKYKDDKAKQQQAMLELYRNEKINPLAGCLPIFIQVPIFYALYKTLLISTEIRHAPGFLWIKDLSAPDPLTPVNLFGLLPFDPPGFLHLGILSVILGATMWLQFRLNPTALDEMQRKLFSWMPWVFMFIMAPFAAGLHLYWIVNNIVSIGQQWLLLRKYPMPAPAPAK